MSLPDQLERMARFQGKAAGEAHLRGMRDVPPYDLASKSLTQQQMARAWWAGWRSVVPEPKPLPA